MIKLNVRHQLIIHLCCEVSYRLKILENRSIKVANGGSKEGNYGVISSTEFDLLLPPIKRTLLCSVIICYKKK